MAGTVRTEDRRGRQPRTLMGIDEAGATLFLMVADGRYPGHSMGPTRGEAGQVLLAFGARNAMLYAVAQCSMICPPEA